ncbi:MAG: helix-turn-helix domain-containing protein [Verrucomicrobiota bacterium]
MLSLTPTQQAFCDQLTEGSRFIELFSFLPDVYFFCKDSEGRFVFANDAEAVAFGVDSVEDIIGKTDYDFFEPEMADKYLAEDQQVMTSGVPVNNKAWLVPNKQGQLNWYLSSKLPLYSKAGIVIGIAGVMRDLSVSGQMLESYQEFTGVLNFVQQSFRGSIEVAQLASLAGMSVSTLERKFRSLFHITPMQYVMQVRIQAAAEALVRSNLSVGEIAIDCGFYDQSHLTRHFKSAREMTPLQFRKAKGNLQRPITHGDTARPA